MENFETKNQAVIPVNITGKYHTFEMTDELLYLGENELGYMMTCGVDYANNENMFAGIDSLESLICVLFALHKPKCAWDYIREAANDTSDGVTDVTFDFGMVMSCPFFQFDRKATDVFQSLYKKGMIDDNTYDYFNVISGEIFDEEFYMARIAECKSASEILDKTYQMFNGINPFEVGLVRLSDSIREVIFNSIAQNECLYDYVIGQKSSFEFTAPDILRLFNDEVMLPKTEDNGVYDFSKVSTIAYTIFMRSNTLPEEYCTDELFYTLFTNNLMSHVNLVTLDYFKAMVDFIVDAREKNMMYDPMNYDEFVTLILNSDAVLNYPYLCEAYLNKIGKSIASISPMQIAHNLDITRSYNIFGLEYLKIFNESPMESFITSSPHCPAMIIYNMITGAVWYGERHGDSMTHKAWDIDTFKEIVHEEFTFLTDADSNEVTNVNLMSACNSEEEYYNCIASLDRAITKILEWDDEAYCPIDEEENSVL